MLACYPVLPLNGLKLCNFVSRSDLVPILFWMLTMSWIMYPISFCRRASRFVVFQTRGVHSCFCLVRIKIPLLTWLRGPLFPLQSHPFLLPICSLLWVRPPFCGFRALWGLFAPHNTNYRWFTKGWVSKRVALADVPPERKPEQGSHGQLGLIWRLWVRHMCRSSRTITATASRRRKLRLANQRWVSDRMIQHTWHAQNLGEWVQKPSKGLLTLLC